MRIVVLVMILACFLLIGCSTGKTFYSPFSETSQKATGTGYCIPQCDNKQCGGDGCGGTCGTCACGKECDLGVCVKIPPQCDTGVVGKSNPQDFCKQIAQCGSCTIEYVIIPDPDTGALTRGWQACWKF